MTNEEAKELLKDKRMEINYKVNGTTQFSKALDLAIKALDATEQVHTSHSGVRMFPKGVFKAIYEDNNESSGRMTIEEAIKIIKIVLAIAEDFEITVQGKELTEEKCKEAVEIVTKALEQPPCEDAISRSALLEELGEEPFNWNDSPEEFQEVRDYQWFRSLVENAPLVAPKQPSWVPVSEKLPEKSGREMTNERAKEVLQEQINRYGRGYVAEGIEALNKAIKVLGQQSCEDCISRQAAIDAIAKLHPVETEYDCTLYDKLDVRYVLKDLPSVTPTVTLSRPEGHWINLGMMPSCLGAYRWCSNCDCGIDAMEFHKNRYNYCPNCGAKMIESEK